MIDRDYIILALLTAYEGDVPDRELARIARLAGIKRSTFQRVSDEMRRYGKVKGQIYTQALRMRDREIAAMKKKLDTRTTGPPNGPPDRDGQAADPLNVGHQMGQFEVDPLTTGPYVGHQPGLFERVTDEIRATDGPDPLCISKSSLKEEKKKKKGAVAWGDKDPETLNPNGRVFHYFDLIHRRYYKGKKAGGNWGKAGKQVTTAYNQGYTLEEIVASMIPYHEDSDPWVQGHPIDRWSSSIPKYNAQAESAGQKKHRVDTEKLAAEERAAIARFDDECKSGLKPNTSA